MRQAEGAPRAVCGAGLWPAPHTGAEADPGATPPPPAGPSRRGHALHSKCYKGNAYWG
ncbi:MAG: hypothetical protein N2050_00520 [Flavobacteriales bacterium]|nr:hypothetical protein [Flavobacteriales bacterium]